MLIKLNYPTILKISDFFSEYFEHKLFLNGRRHFGRSCDCFEIVFSELINSDFPTKSMRSFRDILVSEKHSTVTVSESECQLGWLTPPPSKSENLSRSNSTQFGVGDSAPSPQPFFFNFILEEFWDWQNIEVTPVTNSRFLHLAGTPSNGRLTGFSYSYFRTSRNIEAFSLCLVFTPTESPSGPPWNEGHWPKARHKTSVLEVPAQEQHKHSFCSSSSNTFITCSQYTVHKYRTSPGAPDLW